MCIEVTKTDDKGFEFWTINGAWAGYYSLKERSIIVYGAAEHETHKVYEADILFIDPYPQQTPRKHYNELLAWVEAQRRNNPFKFWIKCKITAICCKIEKIRTRLALMIQPSLRSKSKVDRSEDDIPF